MLPIQPLSWYQSLRCLSYSNKLTSCRSLGTLNLGPWREAGGKNRKRQVSHQLKDQDRSNNSNTGNTGRSDERRRRRKAWHEEPRYKSSHEERRNKSSHEDRRHKASHEERRRVNEVTRDDNQRPSRKLWRRNLSPLSKTNKLDRFPV